MNFRWNFPNVRKNYIWKEGRKKGRKEGRNEGRKGRKEGGEGGSERASKRADEKLKNVRTCDSVNPKTAARSLLSGVDRYFWDSNLASKPLSCASEKTVRALRRRLL